MATKISGIKGINISKSSVLKDGSKKTGTNDSFRDTANGTTRDNSKNNNQSALDSAMIKMLLGQTELMAKKTKEIEENMRRAEKKEEERRKRQEQADKTKEENRAKQQKTINEQKAEKIYNSVDSGLVNGILSGIMGPVGVMLGKGLNKAGLPLNKIPSKIISKMMRGGSVKSSGGRWGRNDENQSAISVNRRETEAEPINKMNYAITERLDRIIDLLSGRRRSDNGEENKGDNKKSWLSNLLDKFLPKGWLGRLIGWLGPKLLYLAGIAGLAYGFHKFWNWIKDKFGTDWANGLTSGLAQAVKTALKGVGASIEKAANSLKSLKQGFTKAKILGSVSKGLNKLANGSKVGKFLFGNTAKKARAASIAAQKTLQAGNLGRTGKILAGAGKTLSKVGKAAGIVGNAVIIAENGIDAYKKYKAGDKRGAAGSLGKGAGTLAGSALGAKGGAAMGAAIGTMIFPGIGTAVGGLLGGIAGAIGGGWLGSKIGGKAGEKTYDLVTGTKPEEPEVQTEGQYETEDPSTYQSLQLQNESLNMQNEILNTLRQIEWNLSPETQKSLDQSYLDNAQRVFDRPPEVPQYNVGLNGTQTNSNISNPLGIR